MAEDLAGAMIGVFDDHRGPVGNLGRSVLKQEPKEWWVTLVNVPATKVFDATGPNVSKIGTDAQLLTADYAKTWQWAQRLMDHPQGVGGILYRSRHDPACLDLALFQRTGLLPARLDLALDPAGAKAWTPQPPDGAHLVYGPSVQLEMHPELIQAMSKLEIAVLP